VLARSSDQVLLVAPERVRCVGVQCSLSADGLVRATALPERSDQVDQDGVAALGIGSAHDGPTPTLESLAAALQTAMSPETRARAADMAGRIRTDGASVAAKLLIDEVTAGRSRNEMHASRR